MNTIIAGSRGITNYNVVRHAMSLISWKPNCVLCGLADGVDKLGERWATENKIHVKYFSPDWTQYGKRAGIIRNEKMAEYADALVAIWDGESRGTKHMIDHAIKKGITVLVYPVLKMP